MRPQASCSHDVCGDTFEGNITRGDADWISIEMSEGKEYTITVGGSQTAGELNDSILKLMDSKRDRHE